MHVFRRREKRNAESHREHTPAHDHRDQHDNADATYNPHRDDSLYWRTADGYIIAHDIASQNEYVACTPCNTCGGQMAVIAVLNRAGQGLSEMVAICRECKTRTSFLFDISNDVYQEWWADQLGDLYIRQYDGPPREPVTAYDET